MEEIALQVRPILAWTLVLLGGAFMLTGALGVVRLPDFFTRQHAAGVTDTLCATLIILALMMYTGDMLVLAKLAAILLFQLVTSPTASHALAQAAISSGQVPLADDWRQSAAKPAPAKASEAPVPSTAPSPAKLAPAGAKDTPDNPS